MIEGRDGVNLWLQSVHGIDWQRCVIESTLHSVKVDPLETRARESRREKLCVTGAERGQVGKEKRWIGEQERAWVVTGRSHRQVRSRAANLESSGGG